jgi:DNA recombination protein RmuC
MGLELLGAVVVLLIVVGIGTVKGWFRSRSISKSKTVAQLPPPDKTEILLQQVQDELRSIRDNQVKQESVLNYQVEQILDSTGELRDEAYKLSGALSNNQIRGSWGEIQLRRVLELAGMLQHVDFTEQMYLDNGQKRPDVIVHLPGNRHIIIDSKASMMYYLELIKTDDEFANRDGLQIAHAKGLKQHVNSLATKEYWKSLPGSTDYVVLFVPNDSALAAAVTTDGTLMEYAAERKVILAGPSTLLAILFGAAFGWRQEIAIQNSTEIGNLGTELYTRVQAMSVPLDETRRKIEDALESVNKLAWHASNRVYPTGRKLQQLTGSTKDLVERPVTEVQ